MNIQESDILNTLLYEPYINQRILSEASGHSLGVVNRSLKKLELDGYLDEQKKLTEKANREFKKKAPRNAIILADGFGMRTGPDSMEVPKGLLEVRGEVLIERTLRQLHEVGIQEIYIVVGFLKERYEYLIDAYGVELVVNPDYALDSTLYSMSLVLSHLSNTYIIPCGVWSRRSPYHRHELYSWYMVSDSMDKESAVRVNRKMELVSSLSQAGGNAVVGIAYLLEEQAAVVRERIEAICGKGSWNEQYGNPGESGYEGEEQRVGYRRQEGLQCGWPEVDGRMSWETVLLEKDRMIIWARVVHSLEAAMVRGWEQLRRIEGLPGRSEAEALAVCSRYLGAQPGKMSDITPLDKGMCSRSFLLTHKGKKYTVWVPGEKCGQMMDPKWQEQVYTVVSSAGICQAPVYIDPEDGCRIADFPEGAKTCDPAKDADLEKCMSLLRDIHEKGFAVDHEIDLFGLIAFCEKLWGGKPSLYKDYGKTKGDVLSLKSYIDTHRTRKVLTHMDVSPEKFFSAMEGKWQLVGWEYAGMQDPYVDVAMFCINALYDKASVDRLISIYSGGDCPDEIRIRIYCYIAVCGLLKSNWCEYRMKLGEEFGEYSLRQYRYAKEYCRVAREEAALRIKI